MSLRKWWDTYKEGIPSDAGQAQYLETEAAFYAGASSFFIEILDIPKNLSEGEDIAMQMDRIDKLRDELEQFKAAILVKKHHGKVGNA